jgi:ligand-binding SRPBCC domain-containing protein
VGHVRLETVIRAPVARVFDLARDIDFHMRSMAHTGERAVRGRTGGRIELGEEVEWLARHFGLTWRLRSRITAMEPPHLFVDQQVSGPFTSFVHRHEFHEQGSTTLMIDDWRHVAPLGFFADPLLLTAHIRRLLTQRNDLLRREAES